MTNIFSCRESTRLMSEAMDRPLSLSEQLALRAHLLLCAFCRRCEKEFGLLRSVLRSLDDAAPETPPAPGETMPEEARARLRAALRK